MATKKLSTGGTLKTTNKRGLYSDGTYLYAITDEGNATSISLSKYDLSTFTRVLTTTNPTTLSNPKGYRVGRYFQEIVFYDKKNSLLWVNTSADYNTGSFINYPELILVALDLSSSYEIHDAICLKSTGYSGHTNNAFSFGLQVRDAMFTSLYGDRTIICDIDDNNYYQMVI